MFPKRKTDRVGLKNSRSDLSVDSDAGLDVNECSSILILLDYYADSNADRDTSCREFGRY